MGNLGSRLKEVRITLGLKQGDMPQKIGVGSQKTWSNYETGETFPPCEIFQKLADFLNIDLHWLITGEGDMYRSRRKITGKTAFEIPLLTKEQALVFEPAKEIPDPKANSGEYPDASYIHIPWRIMEYSTDLRAIEVFDSRMVPVMGGGDIAIFEATGWKGAGIYVYRMTGNLHIGYAGWIDKRFVLYNEIGKNQETREYKSLPFDHQTFMALGRVRAIVHDLQAHDWLNGQTPPYEGF